MMCRASGGPQLIAKTRSELAIDQIQVVRGREPSLTAAAISNSASVEVGAGKNDGVSKGASPAAPALTHACRPALVLVRIAGRREPRTLRVRFEGTCSCAGLGRGSASADERGNR